MKSMSSLARLAGAAVATVLLAGIIADQAQACVGLCNPPPTVTLTPSSIITGLEYTPEDVANKGQASGYAGLDGSGKVPAAQIASFPVAQRTWNYYAADSVSRWEIDTSSSAFQIRGFGSVGDLILWTNGAPIIHRGGNVTFIGDNELDIGNNTSGRPRNVNVGGYVKTSAPAGSSHHSWKLGSVVTATCTLDTTIQVFVEIEGVVRKLAVCQ